MRQYDETRSATSNARRDVANPRHLNVFGESGPVVGTPLVDHLFLTGRSRYFGQRLDQVKHRRWHRVPASFLDRSAARRRIVLGMITRRDIVFAVQFERSQASPVMSELLVHWP